MAQGGWTDTGGRCREAERFPTGGFALGERTIEASHGKAARAWRTLRCVHRPAFEHRKRRSACCGDRFRSAGSGVTGSGHSGKAVHTSMAEICGCCALRRTVDAGDPAYAETT